MQRGIATFTLDYGVCPRWLFERMVRLGREMTRVIVDEYGPDEFVRRIGHPGWFQSLGTVLAFDWNASGLTTILTAALKQAIRGNERAWGLYICGGKGKTSRRTPDEIAMWGEEIFPEEKTNALVYNSRMAAKVDGALIQDGYQIYHHSFFFSRNGAWTVVQQGMNVATQSARRYHWHSAHVKDLMCEPHDGIVSQLRAHTALDLTAKKSAAARDTSIALVQGGYQSLSHDVEILRRHETDLSQTLAFRYKGDEYHAINLARHEFKTHPVVDEHFWESPYLKKILQRVTDLHPQTYEQFVSLAGVGPKTVRALSLVGEMLYGARPSYEDPARYSFAHGGKDATPYPVDIGTYDETIAFMRKVVAHASLPFLEKQKVLQRLGYALQ